MAIDKEKLHKAIDSAADTIYREIKPVLIGMAAVLYLKYAAKAAAWFQKKMKPAEAPAPAIAESPADADPKPDPQPKTE